MKALYYVILHRPKGSKTWLPLSDSDLDREVGNFFASRVDAERDIEQLKATNHSCYLPGPRKIVPSEFCIGQVTKA